MLRAIYLIVTVALVVGWVFYCCGPLSYKEPIYVFMLPVSLESRPGLAGFFSWQPQSRADYFLVFALTGILMTLPAMAISLWIMGKRRRWVVLVQKAGVAASLSLLFFGVLCTTLALIPVTHPGTNALDRLWRIVAFTHSSSSSTGGPFVGVFEFFTLRSGRLLALWGTQLVVAFIYVFWWTRNRERSLWESQSAHLLGYSGVSLAVLSLAALLWPVTATFDWSTNGCYTGFMLGWMAAISGFSAGSICIIFNRRYCALYNVCHQCHYNLTGSVFPNCPECGAAKTS